MRGGRKIKAAEYIRKPTVRKAVLTLLISVAGCTAMYCLDNSKTLERDEEGRIILKRSEQGEGAMHYNLEAEIEGEGTEKITLRIEEREETADEGAEKTEDYLEDEKSKEQREDYPKLLEKEIRRTDEETREEKYVLLPNQIDGRKVSWRRGKDNRAFALLTAGLVGTAYIFVSESQEKKEKEKKREKEMFLCYPQMLNKLCLYVGTGMALRTAWMKIEGEYKLRMEETGRQDLYEEMIYTANQIRGGLPEAECYEDFGQRCRYPPFKKLGNLLSQNLRKGTKGLSELLERESEEVFEERKNLARKLGEEAGTKLMIPMFMMLIVVFIIVVFPAFSSIQI